MKVEFTIDVSPAGDQWSAALNMHAVMPPSSGPGWAHGTVSVGDYELFSVTGHQSGPEAATAVFTKLRDALVGILG